VDFELAAGGGSLTVGVGGMRAQAPEGTERTYAVAVPVMLGADQAWGVTNATGGSTVLEVSGEVSDGGSGFGIAKTGNGLLVLSGESGYGGVTTVAAGGGLRALGAHALGSADGATVVASNGWLEVGGGVLLAEPLTAGDAGALGAVRSTDGTNTLLGRLTQKASTRVRALAGSRLTLAGGVSGSYDLVLAPDAGGEVAVSNAPLSLSSRKLLATGEGTVGLGGSGHVFGTLEVGGGSVRMEAAGALPASSVLALGDALGFGGTVDLNGFDQTVAQLKRGISSPGARRVTASRPATLTVSGGTSTAYDGTLDGALGLAKAGTSTLTLSGTNVSYTGATVVGGGILLLSGSGGLQGSLDVRVEAGTLSVQTTTNGLPDAAVLRIADGAKVYVKADLVETVGSLYLAGRRARRGKWGASAATADFVDTSHFSGTGAILVLQGTESVLMVR